MWIVKLCCWWLDIHKGQILIPNLSCLHVHWTALENGLLKKKGKTGRNQLCVFSCQNLFIHLQNEWSFNKKCAFLIMSAPIHLPAVVESWSVVHWDRIRCEQSSYMTLADCHLLEIVHVEEPIQNQVTICWHYFLVAAIKTLLIYNLCHMCRLRSIGPAQDFGWESQVMSLGLVLPWLTFKLSGLPWYRWHPLISIFHKCLAFERLWGDLSPGWY